MVPPDQGLRAHDPAVAQVHLGLQEDDEFVPVEGGPQLLHGAQPVAAGGARDGVGDVDLHAVAGALGAVHRDVGAVQQLLDGRRRCRGGGDTDADPDVQPDAGHRERRVQQVAQPLGERARLVRLGGRHQDGELVAAEPGQDVVGTQAAPQPRADLAQQVVTGGVAQAVVDLLEPVEVEQAAAGARDGRGDDPLGPLEQRAAVGEPGELVGTRLELDLVVPRTSRKVTAMRTTPASTQPRASQPARSGTGSDQPGLSTTRLATRQTSGTASSRQPMREPGASTGAGRSTAPSAAAAARTTDPSQPSSSRPPST